MPNYDIHALHRVILQNLLAVDKMASKWHLRYYIWAGTMIGAIRHRGFIPWDDDIDIAMPRRDYDLLAQNSKAWLPEGYEFVSAETDSLYPLPFGKIQDGRTTLIERIHLKYLGGVYIDVFPIDGVPDNALLRRWKFVRYEYFKRVLYLLCRDPYKGGFTWKSLLPLLVRRIYSLGGVQKSIQRLLKEDDFDACRLVADYDDGLQGVMPKSVLGTPTPYDFEGEKVMGVEHFHQYLTQKYGDYMQLPPKEQRRQHNFHYCDLQHGYREFQG